MRFGYGWAISLLKPWHVWGRMCWTRWLLSVCVAAGAIVQYVLTVNCSHVNFYHCPLLGVPLRLKKWVCYSWVCCGIMLCFFVLEEFSPSDVLSCVASPSQILSRFILTQYTMTETNICSIHVLSITSPQHTNSYMGLPYYHANDGSLSLSLQVTQWDRLRLSLQVTQWDRLRLTYAS